jgi:hypothetical protein
MAVPRVGHSVDIGFLNTDVGEPEADNQVYSVKGAHAVI